MESWFKKRVIEKVIDEIKIGFPISRKWSKKQKDKKFMELYEKYVTNGLGTKVVAAYSIYNEEQFLQDSIESCCQLNDIDAIHILDGAWEHGGKSINSTDNTKEIVENLKIPIPIIFEENPHNRLWKSESEKRNYQLNRIEEKFGNRVYALVIDGDEIIKFSTGRLSLWLKKGLNKLYPDVGMIKVYTFHSDDLSIIGGRLLPMGKNIHYHTERSMIIHDDNCNIVINYNLNEVKGNPKICFIYEGIFFVNLRIIRNNDRLDEKSDFCDFLETQKHNNKKCLFENYDYYCF